MRRQLTLALGFIALGAVAGRADTDKKGAARPNAVEVRFGDGSKVRMLLLQDSVEIVTRYGKLLVPTADIRGIDLGVHLPEGAEEKIEKAIKRLGGTSFKDRDAAINELVEMAVHAYPALKAAVKSSDLEVAQRAAIAVKRIEAKVDADLLRVRSSDRIITTDFPISGRIVSPTIKAKTPYFGELALKLPELRSIRALSGQADTEVSIDAAKYANATQWLDTGVTLDGNTALTITATGEIDLLNDGSGDFVCGPTGSRNIGGRRGPGGRLPGALIGRIGEAGTPFIVGAHHNATTAPAGKLYLQIQAAPFNNGQVPSGAFKVTIRSGHFFDGR
jgi:hypothetical protein